MTLLIANDMESYMADPSHSDGIIFLHISKEDGEKLAGLATKYGKEIKRYQINEDIDNVPSKEWTYEDDATCDEFISRKMSDVKSKRAKKVWIHKGNDNKHINEDDLSTFTSAGWKVGKAEVK